MKFQLPEGFEMPPEIKPGGEFMVVARLRDNQDGSLTLLEIDDAEVGGEEEEEETEETIQPPRESMYDRAKQAGITKQS